MGNFTFEEMNLMCIYNTGSRTGLIDSLPLNGRSRGNLLYPITMWQLTPPGGYIPAAGTTMGGGEGNPYPAF